MTRTMLSESLEAVVAQRLVKKTGGGRCAAYEIMIGTPAIRNLIREAKVPQIYGMIQVGREFGMVTMDQSLDALVTQNLISADSAKTIAVEAGNFETQGGT
jgi:twitching motility protein PilT